MRDEAPAHGPQELDRRALALVILLITAFAVEQGLTYPLISLALARDGLTESLIGFNAALFTLGLAAATLAIRALSLRVSADRLICLSLFGSAVCLALFYAIDAFWFWCLNRFALGFFTSLTYIYSEAWLNSLCPDRIRGRVSGLYGAGMSIGFAAGPLALPLFGTRSDFGFLAVAVYVALVGLVAALFMPHARLRLARVPRRGLRRFVVAAPMIAGMAFAFGYADTAAISIMPVYFVKTGHDEAFAALTVSMIALPTALVQPLVGSLLDHLPRRRVAAVCAATVAGGFLLVPVVESETAILVVYAVIGSATFALYTCALTMLGARFSGGLLVAGSAAISLAYALGGSGALLTSIAMELVGPVGAPLSIAMLMAGFCAAFMLRRES